MPKQFNVSAKQYEAIHATPHRWNFKTGATRSGKTYLDVVYTIPQRILDVKGKSGLAVLIGNTKGTLQRNIIEPLVERFGSGRVSDIRSDNTATLFGEKIYCLGADKRTSVDRIRGMSIKYAYGDEVTTWDEEVFEMLKSRLDKPYSVFDGTCNPDTPTHWLKRFLDSDADIWQQAYKIDDNPFLPAEFVENLKREYAGTVYYQRYIEGLWVSAQGVIYRKFCDNPQRYIIDKEPDIMYANIGVDFGGGTSAHAFSCVGWTRGFAKMIVLDEYHQQEASTPEQLCNAFVDFARRCMGRWRVADCYCDSAEQTLINGLRVACDRQGVALNIWNAMKKPINDRIRALCMLLGADRFQILKRCEITQGAMLSAVWDSKNAVTDVRLDNGTTNIDSLDAMEYAYEREIPQMLSKW